MEGGSKGGKRDVYSFGTGYGSLPSPHAIPALAKFTQKDVGNQFFALVRRSVTRSQIHNRLEIGLHQSM